MGVPKFYRWISERYPCLSEVISDTQIPEFDNLYLDMNGIIHNCSHPNDDDVTFRITEEQIFLDIFAYIEKLFKIINPQKVFFMAIDGVAPRAKMNQQRARRFMSARTAEEQLRKAVQRGEDVPTEKRFDSNCITPGTPFMDRLHQELIKWIESKVRDDKHWQGIRVYLSGHNCPGEGEHKIMDFIRSERISEGYNPNTRHCMYGLDADLIMLGICSHEPHFSLLREEVKFTGRPQHSKNKKPAKQTTAPPSVDNIVFHLLHLSLLREYLSWEFESVKESLPFEYDMERIIDDWVLMGFLIGNDFIPHLPHIHIHDDALPLLYRSYKQVLPQLDGYINEGGELNLKRFEIFLKTVAANDKEHFMQIMEDDDFLRAKRSNGKAGQEESLIETDTTEEELVRFESSDIDSTEEEDQATSDFGEDPAFISSDEEAEEATQQSRGESSSYLQGAADLLANLDNDPIEDEFSEALALAEFREMNDEEFKNSVENCWSKSIGNSFKRHKKNYYKSKLNFGNVSKQQMKEQSEGYVRAIQWVLHYYYHGCVSWNWFFKHHYAPYISDVVDFSQMEMAFELSEPFKPFEQLLAVLPAASSDCLPEPLRELMSSTESPIADFYPTDFETDLNGKKNDWEAVVLIPFIEENRLLAAIESKSSLLTEEERMRNSHGGHVFFNYDLNKEGSAAPQIIHKDIFRIPQKTVIWGLLPNVNDVFFPGFPTMKHKTHRGVLKKVNVKVFNMPSKKPSMVLTVDKWEESHNDVSKKIIGEEVLIDWPILKIAKVVSVQTYDHKFVKHTSDVEQLPLSTTEKAETIRVFNQLKERQLSRFAIEVTDDDAIVYVQTLIGVKYEVVDGMMIPRKQWGSLAPMPVLSSLVVSGVKVDEGRRLNSVSIEEAYAPKTKAFVLEPRWAGFGFPVLIEKVESPSTANCRVVVLAAVSETPELESVLAKADSSGLAWFSSYDVGKKCGINGKLVSRITGTIFLKKVDDNNASGERLNIGLNLKSSKHNMEVHNYTRRLENGYWQYSHLCIRILSEYRNEFKELFSFLSHYNDVDDNYCADSIWAEEKLREKKFDELREYLSSVPTASLNKSPCGSEYADDVLIGCIENSIRSIDKAQPKLLRSSIKPDLLFRHDLCNSKILPDPQVDFKLLDRVVHTGAVSSIPFGLQGTVIGIEAEKIEVIFDKEFKAAYKRASLQSCSKVPKYALINATFGKNRKSTVLDGRSNVAKETPQSQTSSRRNKKGGQSNEPVGPYVAWEPKGKHGPKAWMYTHVNNGSTNLEEKQTTSKQCVQENMNKSKGHARGTTKPVTSKMVVKDFEENNKELNKEVENCLNSLLGLKVSDSSESKDKSKNQLEMLFESAKIASASQKTTTQIKTSNAKNHDSIKVAQAVEKSSEEPSPKTQQDFVSNRSGNSQKMKLTDFKPSSVSKPFAKNKPSISRLNSTTIPKEEASEQQKDSQENHAVDRSTYRKLRTKRIAIKFPGPSE